MPDAREAAIIAPCARAIPSPLTRSIRPWSAGTTKSALASTFFAKKSAGIAGPRTGSVLSDGSDGAQHGEVGAVLLQCLHIRAVLCQRDVAYAISRVRFRISETAGKRRVSPIRKFPRIRGRSVVVFRAPDPIDFRARKGVREHDYS